MRVDLPSFCTSLHCGMVQCDLVCCVLLLLWMWEGVDSVSVVNGCTSVEQLLACSLFIIGSWNVIGVNT
jgi:hypothetical protein